MNGVTTSFFIKRSIKEWNGTASAYYYLLVKVSEKEAKATRLAWGGQGSVFFDLWKTLLSLKKRWH